MCNRKMHVFSQLKQNNHFWSVKPFLCICVEFLCICYFDVFQVCLNDPNKETETMMLLPILYKRCYNQLITIPKAKDLTTSDNTNVSCLNCIYHLAV